MTKIFVKIFLNSSQLYGTWNGILNLPVQIKTILSNTADKMDLV